MKEGNKLLMWKYMGRGGNSMAKKEELTDNTILWRYMNLEGFLSFVLRKKISFCRLDIMRNIDKYEGTSSRYQLEASDVVIKLLHAIGEKTGNAILKENVQIEKSMEFAREEINKIFYVNGWHVNKTESTAMWDSFAKLNTGIAIKTTFGKIKKWIGSVNNGEIYNIEYDVVKYDSLEYTLDDCRPLLRKEKYFTHENELRLYFQYNDDSKSTLVNEYRDGISSSSLYVNNPERIDIDVTSIEELIDEIIINPKAEEWYIGLIKELLISHGIGIDPRISDIKFKKIEIDSKQYKLINDERFKEILKSFSFVEQPKNH